jgi:hypothetical protein
MVNGELDADTEENDADCQEEQQKQVRNIFNNLMSSVFTEINADFIYKNALNKPDYNA